VSATQNQSAAPGPVRASSTCLEQGAVSDVSLTNVHMQLLREKPEPTEGFSPIPIFILFVFSAVIFVSGIYMGTKSGNFSALAFDVTRDYNVVAETAPTAFDPMQVGARIYTQQCAVCHQPTGQGVPNAFPPLANSEYVTGDEQRLIKIVTNGLKGPVTVNGAAFNSIMPAQASAQTLVRGDPQRLAAVLTYIRASFGNTAAPVAPEKVSEVWAAVGSRTTEWTIDELGK
jgi:mono/diheme cytochrome c family protein